MKQIFLCGLTLLMMLAATSCIFDAPDDKFYRTLWKSDELTLEFLCGQTVCIKTNTGIIKSHGNYESCGAKAVFQNFQMDTDEHIITFIKAERNKDILTLFWKTDNSAEPHTTTLHRLGTPE